MILLHYENIEMKRKGKNFYQGLSFYRASVKKLYHFILFQTL